MLGEGGGLPHRRTGSDPRGGSTLPLRRIEIGAREGGSPRPLPRNLTLPGAKTDRNREGQRGSLTLKTLGRAVLSAICSTKPMDAPVGTSMMLEDGLKDMILTIVDLMTHVGPHRDRF